MEPLKKSVENFVKSYTNFSIAINKASRKIVRLELKMLLKDILFCVFEVMKFFSPNLNYEEKNSCLNFEMMLSDIEVKIWRISDVISVIKNKAHPSIYNGLQIFGAEIKKAGSDEKESFENAMNEMTKIGKELKVHKNILEESLENILNFGKALNKFYAENCRCTKEI